MVSALHASLAALLGPKGHSMDPSVIGGFLPEWRGQRHGSAEFLARPSSTKEVQGVLRLCREAGASITIQGGNTGLVGAQTPMGEVLLSLQRMNAIRLIDADDDALIAEAGVRLEEVHRAASTASRSFPLSLASQGSATVGGLLSTNAGGVHVLRYGMMRDLVLGIEAVLPNGEIFSGLKTLRKDNTGYDLKQLLIGAEGTLGVITAASLKLFPPPRMRQVAVVRLETPEEALALLHRAKAETGAVAAFEIMNRTSVALTVKNVPGMRDPFPGAPYIVLLEFESVMDIPLRGQVENLLVAWMEEREGRDVVLAESETQARAFWALRESMSAGHRGEGPQVNHDISVPVSRVPDFLRAVEQQLNATADLRIVAFGHMGDGNIHFSALAAPGAAPESFPAPKLAEIVHETALARGGSISAEHGVGVSRKADFARYKDPLQIAVMRQIRDTLDPDRLLNPRVLF